MGAYKYFGNGIKSKIVTVRFGPKRGQSVEMYYFEVWFHGKRITEKGGTTDKQAMKRQAQRLNEIADGTYTPPRDRRRAERKAAVDREALRFDKAAALFVEKRAADYCRPKDVGYALARMARHFAGRYLDEITRADVADYSASRLRRDTRFHAKGAAVAKVRKNGLRAGQTDVRLLSSVFGFMQDAGHELENPCLRPLRRGAQTKRQTYVPAHEPALPTPEALAAIFAARPARVTDEHRALVTLAAYTGGRPESDLLRLDHGDVEFVDAARAVSMDGTPILGWVWFRDAKTPAGRRKVPLHPTAAEALRTILLPEPKEADSRVRWSAMPVFRTTTRKGDARGWDRASYRKAWAAILGACVEEHPQIAGLWLRDLRPWFRTQLTDALAPEAVIRYLMGHARGVSMGYYVPTDAALRKAIALLPTPTLAAAAPREVRAQVAV